MKGIPVIKSKLVMPQLPRAVMKSNRIRGLIDSIEKKSIVVVTAPAGYGKTTLIVTALSPYKAKGYRICWYRLDDFQHVQDIELTDDWQLIVKSLSSMMYYLSGDLKPAHKQIQEAVEAILLRTKYL